MDGTRDSYHMMSYVNLKKNDTNEFIYKTEIDPQTYKANLWLSKEKRGGYIRSQGQHITIYK